MEHPGAYGVVDIAGGHGVVFVSFNKARIVLSGAKRAIFFEENVSLVPAEDAEFVFIKESTTNRYATIEGLPPPQRVIIVAQKGRG